MDDDHIPARTPLPGADRETLEEIQRRVLWLATRIVDRQPRP